MAEAVIWDVVDAYFNHGGGPEAMSPLVQHQIGSYNEFIDRKLGQIIRGFNPVQICHMYREDIREFVHKIYIRILNPSLSKPFFQTPDGSQLLMTPHFARMNNLTYASNLLVDVNILTETINEDGITERKEATIPNVSIGKFPIMVRSKLCTLTQMPGTAEGNGKHECRYDFGGYFIINGNEKVVISQDRISENRTVVFAGNVNADGLTAEIRSMPDGVFLPPKTCALHLNAKPNQYGRTIRLTCTFLRTDIPLFTMFRALGIENDEDIIRFIVLDIDDEKQKRVLKELAASADDASDVRTQADALRILQRSMSLSGTPREYLDQPAVVAKMLQTFMENDFLPHVGHTFNRKALYLGYMARKLIRTYLGYDGYDNRDSYIHKRIDTPGVLIGNLFRQCYGKMIKEMRNLIQRELHVWRASTIAPQNIISASNVHRFLKQTVIESGMRYSLSTGNWGVKSLGGFQNIRQGVAQVLNRLSYYSMLSHLRRVNTPMEKNGKLVQPRKLENTQYGMICPAETPEGGAVGLVKNMAMGSQVTNAQSSANLRASIEMWGVRILDDTLSAVEVRAFLARMGTGHVVSVIINGDIMGYHDRPAELYAALKHAKRTGTISAYTAIIWDVQKGQIAMSTEAGRMCRPLFIVDASNQLRLAKGLANGHSLPVKGAPFATFMAPMVAEPREPREPTAANELGGEGNLNGLDGLDGGNGDNEDDQDRAHGRTMEGFVEMMDVEELDKSMVAMFPKDLTRLPKGVSMPPKYTHCEIHPSMLLGVLGVNIPFSNHNQAPRNAYQCLWEEELVWMADCTAVPIKDVHVGDRVMCFNPKTMMSEETVVTHHMVRDTDKKIYKVTMADERSIVATEDHMFYTMMGWRRVDTMTTATKLFMYNPEDPDPVNAVPVQVRSVIVFPVQVRVADITVASPHASFITADGFASHNCSMGKQAVGVYMSNYQERIDTMAHVLNYPQAPIVRTRLSKYMNIEKLPSGINAIVAIMTYSGFNQEDSVMLNQSAIDRGLFTSTYYKSYRDQCNKNHSTGEEEIFTRPVVDGTSHMKAYNYEKLGDDGFVPENTWVGANDVLVGKVMPIKVHGQIHPRDASLFMKSGDEGRVDRNYTGLNADGYRFCKVRLRQYRKPTVGDKVASTAAQKGTIGMVYRQQDMPFTKDGISPDIIINPHAIPSRMTVGQLMECLMGKACTMLGTKGDATPFRDVKMSELADVLASYGMERYGNEVLYDGRTGMQMKTEIFIGPTYYQRLKHMVCDKVHCTTENHTVLVRTGWKKIAEVTMDDEVATLVNNKELRYVRPTAVLAFPDFSGRIYRIKNQGIDLEVTAGHRMLVSTQHTRQRIWSDYRLVPAEDIAGKMAKYKKDCEWTVPDYQFILPEVTGYKCRIYPAKTVDMDAWLTFFGTWIAEGCAVHSKTKSSYIVNVCVIKNRVRTALKAALDKMEYKYATSDVAMNISNRQLHTYMLPYSVGAPHKFLPDWAWSLSASQCRTLIHAMQLGDGSFYEKTGCSVYYTSSVRLADDFQRLCIHAGWTSNITLHIPAGNTVEIRGKTVVSNYDVWRLSVVKKRVNPTVNHSHVHTQNVQVEEFIEYTGPVYCLQVPSEVFMVRRNGKAVWTGNSRGSSGPVVLLTRQPAEGRARNGGLRFGEMERDAIVGHGASAFIKERMSDCSDFFRVYVCRKCGILCTANPERGIYRCSYCKNGADIAQVRIPYSMKLLIQELMTMSVVPRFVV